MKKVKVMPRYKDEPVAVRIYTVSDESKYLIVRNVPALGCGDELLRLFSTYGRVDECKPMDAEECEPFTDVYWIKFYQVNNSRFAKRKLDNYVFLGNMLQVSYAPQYESLSDTTEKLEWRRKEVIARLNLRRPKGAANFNQEAAKDEPLELSNSNCKSHIVESASGNVGETPLAPVSTDTNYFPSQSMNQTVQLVREKLNKIRSSGEQIEVGVSKRSHIDTRRRI